MPAQKKKRRRRLNIKRLIILIILLAVIVTAGIGAGFVVGVVRNMPNWQPDSIEANLTTFFYDKNGEQVATRYLENRIPVSFDEIPDTVKEAFLAIEDHQFYNHNGINLYRIMGAVWANIRHGWGSQGGSTITIQLANKAFIDHHEKKLERKVQEALMAIQLERIYSKDEIFEMYLNLIYFGNGANGIQAAARSYFGKDVSELDLAESAFLAGVVQRPATYNPYKNPDRAKSRRNLVLDQMVKYGYITEAQAAEAKAQDFNLNTQQQQQTSKYPFFIDHAVQEAEDILESLGISPMELYRSGLHVYTTMDTKIQQAMEDVYSNPDNFPPVNTEEPVQSAMAVLDHRTGEILGLVGGREHVTQRGLNRATQAKRSPGSVIKPLVVYGPALEQGFGPATVLDDVPVSYPNPAGKPYEPRNYDGRWRGLITMREAVKHSVNIPAVKTMEMIGVNTGWEFGKRLGLPLTDNDRNLSLSLGGMSHGFSPLEVASAYGAFANKGIRVEPYAISKILDNEGNVIWEAKPRQHVVMSEETAYLMTDMLISVVQSGTGTRAKMNRPVAGKTGTTQLPDLPEFRGKTGNTDAWWAGYTPEYTGVVWMGYDKTDGNHYLNRVYGGRYPAQIWKAVMEVALKDEPVVEFERPKNIVYRSVDAKSGLIPSDLTPPMFIITEAFHKDHVPQDYSDVWVEAQVCAESGLLPSPNCPHVLTGLYLKRPIPYDPEKKKPEDADLELPTTVCPIHGSGEAVQPAEGFEWPEEFDRPVDTPAETPLDEETSRDEQKKPSPEDNIEIPRGPAAPELGGQISENNGRSTVTLIWNQVGEEGSIAYSIERWSKENPTRYSIGMTTDTSFEDTKVEKGQTYYYRVFAIDSNDLSTPSNEITVLIH
ncbi:MAG: PBP1A family penicillin-binding protein [Clostridia bacterium]|jgi:penicillin-binding protein 1A|nr:PBP1A family penicillin-binding protein [Clostridia bacterium]